MKVMVATTGATLLHEKAVKTLCEKLLPKTYILTPNIPEANLILREADQEAIDIKDLEGLKQLASALQTLGPKYVLVKGGHLPLTSDYKVAQTDKEKQIVVNVLLGRHVNTGVDVLEVIEFPYQNSRNTHGTGDSLASAISCNLANEQDIVTAVHNACRYVDAGIRTSTNLGQGSGPLNHFHSLQILPFAPGCFIDYVLSRPDVKAAWHDFTYHEFVRRMGDGTLPRETFKYYMIQDYLYLVRFPIPKQINPHHSYIPDPFRPSTCLSRLQKQKPGRHRRCEYDFHGREVREVRTLMLWRAVCRNRDGDPA